MDISKLKRNPEQVQSTLTEKNGQLITKSGCHIQIPAGYTSKGLATISNEVSTLGIFAIITDEKYYSLSLITSMMVLVPSDLKYITIDDKPYIEMWFAPGSVVIKNTSLVKNKKLVNFVMDYYVDYGKIPWFLSYVDHAEIFKLSREFNNIFMADSIVPYDIITAHISRSPDDFNSYYRHTIEKQTDLYAQPTIIPSRDIANNTNSNLARINGSELNKALKSALTSAPQEAEPLEELYLK